MPLHKLHCINLSKFLIQQVKRSILTWLIHMLTLLHYMFTWLIPYGLVAMIPGFHPGGSGSIPGMGSCVLEEQRCVAFH